MQRLVRAVPSPAVIALAVAATFATACATLRSSAAPPDERPQVLVDASGRVYRTSDTPAAASFVTPPDSTFKAVLAAYNTLGIDPTTVDPAGHVVAGQHMVLRSRFEGQPLSAVFDCGSGPLGPRADEGRISAEVTTHVVASGAGSAMSTMIKAFLTPNDGVSRDPIRCVSRGRIEERLRREVTTRLGLAYEAP